MNLYPTFLVGDRVRVRCIDGAKRDVTVLEIHDWVKCGRSPEVVLAVPKELEDAGTPGKRVLLVSALRSCMVQQSRKDVA